MDFGTPPLVGPGADVPGNGLYQRAFRALTGRQRQLDAMEQDAMGQEPAPEVPAAPVEFERPFSLEERARQQRKLADILRSRK